TKNRAMPGMECTRATLRHEPAPPSPTATGIAPPSVRSGRTPQSATKKYAHWGVLAMASAASMPARVESRDMRQPLQITSLGAFRAWHREHFIAHLRLSQSWGIGAALPSAGAQSERAGQDQPGKCAVFTSIGWDLAKCKTRRS